MRRGILFQKSLLPKANPFTIEEWVRAGLRKFRTDPITTGYAPAIIQVNPNDNGFPHGLTINGLPVVCNPEVREGYLRVATVDLGEDV